MLLRVRHPGAEPRDIDLGPATPYTRRSAREPRNGAVVGDMTPVLTMGGLIAMSPRHGATDQWADTGRYRRRFSIRPENRIELCGAAMKYAGRCRLAEGHKDHHRSDPAFIPTRPDAKMNRWELVPRCGVMMAIAKEPCGRVAGHLYNHSTAAAIADGERARRARKAA